MSKEAVMWWNKPNDYINKAQYMRQWRLSKLFNMTEEDYNALLCFQGGGCALCGKEKELDGKHLAVDHDHETGKVRGLLCRACNGYVAKADAVLLGQRVIRQHPYYRRVLAYIKSPPTARQTAVNALPSIAKVSARPM